MSGNIKTVKAKSIDSASVGLNDSWQTSNGSLTIDKVEKQPQKLTSLPGKPIKMADGSTNKTVYLVTVENPYYPSHPRCFVTAKLDYINFGVELVGYEIAYDMADKIKTEQDAIELIGDSGNELYSIVFPQQKVVSIRNVSYKLKQ